MHINFKAEYLIILTISSLMLMNSCSDNSTAPEDENGDDDRSYCELEPLPAPTGNIINVSNVGELLPVVDVVNSDDTPVTILLASGTYEIPYVLYFTADSLTIRSASGNRDDVIIRPAIDADGIIWFTGDNMTIADLTLGWVSGIGIKAFHGADDCLMHNLRIVDTGQHMLKVDRSSIPASTMTHGGEVRWCLFEYSAGEGPGAYIGGIFAAQSDGLIVHHNVFRGIKAPGSEEAGAAIFFWIDSANTIVEHNTIYNCDQGIILGWLGGEASQMGGIIRNNMVHTNKGVGIKLEGAESVSIYNNTVFTENYYASIEYRWESTRFASIINNLSNNGIIPRDGGTGVLETNVVNAQSSWFIDATGGDLRLAEAQAIVVDQGTDLTAVPIDFECDGRPKGDSTDIGADEY